jgi:hypothetical protein
MDEKTEDDKKKSEFPEPILKSLDVQSKRY